MSNQRVRDPLSWPSLIEPHRLITLQVFSPTPSTLAISNLADIILQFNGRSWGLTDNRRMTYRHELKKVYRRETRYRLDKQI